MRRKPAERNAFTLTELVVAATLMVSAMSIIAPMTLCSGRLLHDAIHQQLVMDELSSELERLTSLQSDQREGAIAQLSPSAHLKEVLPSAEITAETVRDDDGTRLVLSLNWDRPGNARPVTLVGWLDPLPIETDVDSLDSQGEASE